MSRASRKKRSKTHKTRKPSAEESKHRNQDEHRWRKVAAWTVPLVVVPVTLALSADGRTGVWLTVIVSVVFLVYVLIILEWYIWRAKPERNRLRLASVFVIAFVIAAGFIWQSRIEWHSVPHGLWLALTDDEKHKFVEVLLSQTETRERIMIACPPMNEQLCISATPFVDLFKRGRFIVENDRVDRVILGKPSAGVTLFKYGHADAFDPQDPDQGKWVRQTASLLTVQQAFDAIGIEVKQVADESFPPDIIGIFFGVEPRK